MDTAGMNTPQEIPVIEEKSPKKNSLALVLLLIIFIIGGLTLTYLFLDGQKYIDELLGKEVQTVEEEETASDDNKIDEYADWQVYTNTKYGISFKYPSDWEVEISDNDSIIAHAMNEKEGTERQAYLWIVPGTNSTKTLEYVKTLQEDIENEDPLMNASLNYTEILISGKDAYMYIPGNVAFLSSGYVVEHKDNILDIRFRGLAELGYWHIIESITFLD
ncbi:MAG: PsbP-related protein [Candidatus Dojkabacteria bacterium]|jgi:hypothetical protein|nr:PsbP-related protein [Candidatus Dojkabacteria bacterium]